MGILTDLKNNYSLFFESIIIVTGPSFVNSTFMSDPNLPDLISFSVNNDNSSLNNLYNGLA